MIVRQFVIASPQMHLYLEDFWNLQNKLLISRFGIAMVKKGGYLKLENKRFKTDFTPIEEGCECQTCKNHSRAYINMVMSKVSIFLFFFSKFEKLISFLKYTNR